MKDLRPGQLLRFHERLMQEAPEGFEPHYFAVQEKGKAPGVNGSWKTPYARLTIAEARKRLKENIGNVGIAARPEDPLLLLDVDDPSILDQVKDTLKVRSRSRGTEDKPQLHGFYFAEPEDEKLPANIPTEKGELRSEWQYVVAPGSFVPCTEKELDNKVEKGEISEEDKEEILDDPFRGFYTIHEDRKISKLKFEELPEPFKENYGRKKGKTPDRKKEGSTSELEEIPENASQLFHLQITDLTQEGLTGRDPHPLHDSETGSNWCISMREICPECDQPMELYENYSVCENSECDSNRKNRKKGHCWRHMVSLNPIQYLCVETGYLTCLEAGSPHRKSSAGASMVKGDDQAIWEAWKHAKEQGYIPKDDPVPSRAMKHIARKHSIYDSEPGEMLPTKPYNQVIRTIESEY